MNDTQGNLQISDLLQGNVGALSVTGCLLFKEWDSQDHCFYCWEEWQLIGASNADTWIKIDHDPGEVLFYEPARLQEAIEPWTLTIGQTMPLTVNGVLHRSMIEEVTTKVLESVIGPPVYPLNIGETMTYAEIRLTNPVGVISRLTIGSHHSRSLLACREISLSAAQQKQLFGRVLYNRRSAPGRTSRNIGCAIVAALVSIVLVGGLFSAYSNPDRPNGDANPTSTSHSDSSRSYHHHLVYEGGGGGVGK